MASHEQPYDPYLPSGRSGTPGATAYHHEGTDRTAALQAQIDDTVNVMKQNIKRTAERGENADALQVRTDDLNERSKDWKRTTNRVRKVFFWKNVKMWAWIIGAIIVIIIAIALSKLALLSV
ncbi:MAG: hypothetical protein Q9190_005786 [Brigantiaea leucoxantha]